MSDTFLPGSGFDTYEQQDKVLVGLCGGTGCKAAVRILQQQGFAVMGAVVRLCTDDPVVDAAKEAAGTAQHAAAAVAEKVRPSDK